MSKLERNLRDLPFWSLLLSNIVVIIWAVLGNLPLAWIVWAYWFQTLALSIFSCLRILRFKVFLFRDAKIIKLHFFRKSEIQTKIREVVLKRDEKNLRPVLLYLFALCFFHFLYFMVLVDEMEAFLDFEILKAGGIFFINQTFTFFFQRKKDLRSKVFIEDYEPLIWVRIVPMHVSLLVYVALQNREPFFRSIVFLLVFLTLKTVIDLGVYVLAKRVIQDENEDSDRSIIFDDV